MTIVQSGYATTNPLDINFGCVIINTTLQVINI